MEKKPAARIRNVVETPWQQFPGHFGGALSKPLVRPETAGSKLVDYRISTYQPMAYVETHTHKVQEQIYHVLEGGGSMEIEVAIVGAPFDPPSAGRQGARHAPRAIREASLHVVYWLDSAYESELVDLESGTTLQRTTTGTVVDLGDLNVYPNQVDRSAESFQHGTREIVERGAFPLVLGGDHFVSLPCCRGVADVVSQRGGRLAFITFGCELGLAGEDSVWGTDWSGSVVRRLVETGAVDPRNIAWVGPSGLVPRAEWEWIQHSGATLLTAEDVHRQGGMDATRQALAAAP